MDTVGFSKVKTEEDFLAVLKRCFRYYYSRNMPCNYIGLVANADTPFLRPWFEKYFRAANGFYDWQHGNAQLWVLEEQWKEEAIKRLKKRKDKRDGKGAD